MNEKKVIVVGELNIDIIVNQLQNFPRVGEEILANQIDMVIGSSSSIFACNIQTLGCSVTFAGMVGNDLFGKFIIDELKDKKIDTSLVVHSTSQKTGVTIVLNYDQDRANITHCGAMNEFNCSCIPMEKLREYDHLHFSSFFLQKAMQKEIVSLFQSAKNQGLTTSLDIQWDPEKKWNFPYESCLPYVDFFLPNEAEILSLSGEDKLSNALAVIGKFAATIIVKRSVKGALAYRNGKETHAMPFLHDHFIDAIGAGDSFNAGFIFKYINGYSLIESLEFGNLVGAINTTATGGTAAFETFDGFKKRAKKFFNINV